MNPTQALQKMETQSAKRVFSPPTDIYETDEAIVLRTDLPGVEEAALNITLEANRLEIYAAPERREVQGYNLSHYEYGGGDYERSFVLPDKVDGEKVDAALSNGVLELTLPKKEGAAARRILVGGGK